MTMKMKMLRTRRRFVEEVEESTYWRCIQLYYGENDVAANYTTTTTISTTTVFITTIPRGNWTTAEKDGYKEEEQNHTILWSSIGTAVVVALLCVFVICCLVMSRRSERQKRKRTEAEYRVIATTLTSISTDVEDGTTYEELSSLSDPTYHGDVQLPSRKNRQRIGGVSNGLTQTVKRWFSVEGNEPTQNVTNMNGGATIRPPLPSIPEATRVSLFRSKSDKRVSAHNGEYVEIGADFLRRSNVYNPLDGVSGSCNGDPYDKLRKSTLFVDAGEYPELKTNSSMNENRQSSNYFILEKENKNSDLVKEPSDNYFILEKEEASKLKAATNDVPVDQDNIGNRKDNSTGNRTDNTTSGDVDNLDDNKSLCEGEYVEPNSKPKDTYFILDPETKGRNSASEEEYLEPTDKQRHSYIEVLPEHRELCKKSKK